MFKKAFSSIKSLQIYIELLSLVSLIKIILNYIIIIIIFKIKNTDVFCLNEKPNIKIFFSFKFENKVSIIIFENLFLCKLLIFNICSKYSETSFNPK
jgi:hypothetical protein